MLAYRLQRAIPGPLTNKHKTILLSLLTNKGCCWGVYGCVKKMLVQNILYSPYQVYNVFFCVPRKILLACQIKKILARNFGWHAKKNTRDFFLFFFLRFNKETKQRFTNQNCIIILFHMVELRFFFQLLSNERHLIITQLTFPLK